ncbi:hypothetical protein Bca101_008991 [Brassica carinata]
MIPSTTCYKFMAIFFYSPLPSWLTSILSSYLTFDNFHLCRFLKSCSPQILIASPPRKNSELEEELSFSRITLYIYRERQGFAISSYSSVSVSLLFSWTVEEHFWMEKRRGEEMLKFSGAIVVMAEVVVVKMLRRKRKVED